MAFAILKLPAICDLESQNKSVALIGGICADHGQRITGVHTGRGQVDHDQTSVGSAGNTGPCQLRMGVVTHDNALTLTTGDNEIGAAFRVEPLETKTAPVSPPHGCPALLIRSLTLRRRPRSRLKRN